GDQSGSCVFTHHDHRACLGPELRRAHQHRRRLRQAPAQQGRRSVSDQAHQDSARRRLWARRGQRIVNTRSLSFRLVTWYAGVLTLVFVLLGALTIILLREYLEANVLDTQARRARQITDTLVAAVARTGEAGMAREVEELYAPEVNERFIRITRGDGHVVYASGAPHDGSFDPSTVPAPSLAREGAFLRKESLPKGSVLIAAVSNDKAGTTDSRYVVEVGVSTARTEETVRQVLLMLAIGLPIAVCVAVAGGFVLVRRALKPVDNL